MESDLGVVGPKMALTPFRLKVNVFWKIFFFEVIFFFRMQKFFLFFSNFSSM
jgi:hypothetical protein